jgi:hypothetical protein
MKITELVGIKNKIKDLPQNPRKVAEYPLGLEWHKVLSNNGFRPLGSGSFGTVWDNYKLSYVLKVFSDTDIAYIEWIKASIQHKDNPHMPHFVSPRAVRIVPGVVAIRTEKLTRISEDAYMMLKPMNAVIEVATIERISPSEVITRRGDSWSSRFIPFIEYCKKYPDFIPALDIVYEVVMRPGFRPDLHDENIMMRGSVIVFSDPVFDKKALTNR